MNIALTRMSFNEPQYLIFSLVKTDDAYSARTRKVSQGGEIVNSMIHHCLSEKEAKHKIHKSVRVKILKGGWLRIEIEDLPNQVVPYLEVPMEMQMSPEEMILVLKKTINERYVVFENVIGLQEFFDAGVEYIGYETDDPTEMKVYDRYGNLRTCFTSRMSRVEKTERAIEIASKRDK